MQFSIVERVVPVALLFLLLTAHPVAAQQPFGDPATLLASPGFSEAQRVAQWVEASNDNAGLQYIIVDKVNARLFMFSGKGTLEATAPVLLGMARGDVSPVGIGNRKLSEIRPGERITPAGRFVSGAGEDMDGTDLIWIDYGAAIALHRASDRKPGMRAKSRVERLASTSSLDKRVSLGCINVSTAFYDRHIAPTFGRSPGIVYILPETHLAAVNFRFFGAGGGG